MTKPQLVRSTQNRVIAGVCAGLAHHFDMDVRLMRALFIAGFFVTGLTFWLYIALWIMLPLDTDTPSVDVPATQDESMHQ